LEPITHALTSLVIARAGQKHLPRYGTAVLLTAGVAPDLDYLTYAGGPGAFLRFDRTLLHSIPCATALACAVAAAFCVFDRRRKQPMETSPLAFAAVLAVSAIGAGAHLFLDLASGIGVQMFWPFQSRWYAWDIAANLDPWILVLLAAGLLLPMLFRLVSEEIGDRKKVARGRGGAITTLALLLVYLGGRAYCHGRAMDLLLSREYHGRVPLAAGAFPSASSPFGWRGVVTTDNTIEELDFSLAPGVEFDPERSLTHYKPEDSPALNAGQNAEATKRFLAYARVPLASVVRREDAYRFEVHDVRFAAGDTTPANILVRVELTGDLKIREEEFQFAASPNP
jgi:inner membrane protein